MLLLWELGWVGAGFLLGALWWLLPGRRACSRPGRRFGVRPARRTRRSCDTRALCPRSVIRPGVGNAGRALAGLGPGRRKHWAGMAA
ncbi:DUF6185 family protein [Streptomyces coeruleorubidus]|uniref:DUF6185 family protein n=1 Tax=Streptomyces coeruleorubidus TaxID=116188 RepID=UPI0036A73BA7